MAKEFYFSSAAVIATVSQALTLNTELAIFIRLVHYLEQEKLRRISLDRNVLKYSLLVHGARRTEPA